MNTCYYKAKNMYSGQGRIHGMSILSTDNIQFMYKTIYSYMFIYVLVKLVRNLLCNGINTDSNLVKDIFLIYY